MKLGKTLLAVVLTCGLLAGFSSLCYADLDCDCMISLRHYYNTDPVVGQYACVDQCDQDDDACCADCPDFDHGQGTVGWARAINECGATIELLGGNWIEECCAEGLESFVECDYGCGDMYDGCENYVCEGDCWDVYLLDCATDCTDEDGDGFGSPMSIKCAEPWLDCDDDASDDPAECATCTCGDVSCAPCARCINAGATEICDSGIDDDCDGLVDGADPECIPPPSYPGTANTMAATYGKSSLIGSGVFNALTLVFIPIGAVLAMIITRRKR